MKAAKPEPGVSELNGRIACPPGKKNCKFETAPAWYLNLDFFQTLTVADAQGHRDVFPLKGDFLMQAVRYVTYASNCPNYNCISVVMPTDQTYEFTFTIESELMLNVVKGVGNECPDEAIRYLGLMLPKGSTAKLRITPSGVEDLLYDQNGNGNFSSTLKPASHVMAPRAWDSEGPTIQFSTQPLDAGMTLVGVTAWDETGVKTVIYCVDDGGCLPYGKPIRLARGRPHHLRAFAEDVLGNRGAMYEHNTKP